jgi:hypothetical protein
MTAVTSDPTAGAELRHPRRVGLRDRVCAPYAHWFRLIARPVADLGDCPFGARAALINGLMIRRA